MYNGFYTGHSGNLVKNYWKKEISWKISIHFYCLKTVVFENFSKSNLLKNLCHTHFDVHQLHNDPHKYVFQKLFNLGEKLNHEKSKRRKLFTPLGFTALECLTIIRRMGQEFACKIFIDISTKQLKKNSILIFKYPILCLGYVELTSLKWLWF